MMKAVRKIVNVIHIISLCGTASIIVLGMIYEIIGHAKFEQLLAYIGISDGFKIYYIFGIIFICVLIATHIIKAKILPD